MDFVILFIKPLPKLLSIVFAPTSLLSLTPHKAADSDIIFQEALYSFRKKKGTIGAMMLKLDLDKAFDRLEWSFIDSSLLHMNFPQPLIKLIMDCGTTSSISILVNGTHTPFFQPSRGIRQEDPLFPDLFIICMESLSRSI